MKTHQYYEHSLLWWKFVILIENHHLDENKHYGENLWLGWKLNILMQIHHLMNILIWWKLILLIKFLIVIKMNHVDESHHHEKNSSLWWKLNILIKIYQYHKKLIGFLKNHYYDIRQLIWWTSLFRFKLIIMMKIQLGDENFPFWRKFIILIKKKLIMLMIINHFDENSWLSWKLMIVMKIHHLLKFHVCDKN